MPSERDKAVAYHAQHRGKIEIVSKVPVASAEDLSLAYTPGVAAPCRAIQEDVDRVFDLTNRGNTVAVLTDGSAVLGLGDIGPEASLPVMEGKVILFKMFGGVDAFPLLVKDKDPDTIAHVMELLEPGFGGVNVEDIGAPRCFHVEKRLRERLSIPVFNDDQHGTAIVVGAAIMNAVKAVQKRLDGISVVINGSGAAGLAVAKMLIELGVKDISMVDSHGIIVEGRENLNPQKEEVARLTNREGRKGTLADALRGADVFIGLSVAGVLTMDMCRAMAKNQIIFALANPVPEIWPVQAIEVGAGVVGTGRSDFPNQINNVLGFPGVFRGALDVRATDITMNMKVAAARAIAALAADDLRPDYVIPSPLDTRVAPAVARAVAQVANDEGHARDPKDPDWVAHHCEDMVQEARSKLAARQRAARSI